MEIPPFNLSSFLHFLWITFSHGGWFFLLIAFIYIAYSKYISEIQHQFIHEQKWVFLSIRGAKENLTSLLAVEQIFQQLHALYSGLTWPEKYMEGQVQLWYSFEIVSMGGKVSLVIRVPEGKTEFVKSAIYAEYPSVEIAEVEDYLKDTVYDPKTSNLNIFGTEFKLVEKTFIPLKTYKDFEHPVSEDKIIDPLSPVFEAMGKIQPHEFYAIQILAEPIPDDSWKPAGESFVKSLIGEPEEHKETLTGFLLKPFDSFAHFSFKDFISGSGSGHGEESKSQKNDWMSMTDIAKARVNLTQAKLGKSGFKIKIRHLYMAPKDRFDKAKKLLFLGAFSVFGSAQFNKLKPDSANTGTSVDYRISPDLEEPFIRRKVNKRKKLIFDAFKNRDTHVGIPAMILNSEELATIFHLPLTTSAVVAPNVEKVESKKVQPPPNLPII